MRPWLTSQATKRLTSTQGRRGSDSLWGGEVTKRMWVFQGCPLSKTSGERDIEGAGSLVHVKLARLYM